MNKLPIIIATIFFAGIIAITPGCGLAPLTGGPTQPEKLLDGTYEGSSRHGPNKALVRVTITNGMIEKVELVKYFASWKGARANEIIPQRIVEQQSTSVDAVTGATNSSRVIMNAAQEAINKAYGQDQPEKIERR